MVNGKDLPADAETTGDAETTPGWGRSTGGRKCSPTPSILSGTIQWTEKTGRLQTMGLQELNITYMNHIINMYILITNYAYICVQTHAMYMGLHLVAQWQNTNTANAGHVKTRFNPESGRFSWRRPTPIILPAESHDRGIWQSMIHRVTKRHD